MDTGRNRDCGLCNADAAGAGTPLRRRGARVRRLDAGSAGVCVEEGDVGDSTSIDDIALDVDKLPTPVSDGETAVAPVVLEGPVHVVATPADAPLYQPVGTLETSRSRTETKMRAIPYARWANRGARAMRVWLPLAQE
jgi:uncharacterized protein